MRQTIKKYIQGHLTETQYSMLRKLIVNFSHLWEVRKNVSGKRNYIQYEGAHLKKVRITIIGDDNRIEIGPDSFLENVTITVKGSRHRLVIGREIWGTKSRFFFEDSDCRIFIGNCSKIVGTQISSAERGTILLGEDCVTATGTDIRNTDSHALINLETGKRINPGRDIVIGDHVFAGEGVVILKGVHIGDGCMVAIRSVVTKNFPANCLVGGHPAKVIRQNTSWKWERD